jgi:hypothetical protein
VPPEVALLQVVRRRDLAGEEPTTERRVGDEPDAEVATGVEHAVVLRIASPQRVLGLERSDRVRRVPAPQRVRRSLAHPEVANLAGSDELAHRADGVLDRHVGVDAVLVVEVDDVDTEPLQRRITRRPDVVRSAVHSHAGPVGAPLVAELGGEYDVVATARDGLADELLVGERAVHVGGVQEAAAEVECSMDDLGRRVVVDGAVELAHPHASEAQG